MHRPMSVKKQMIMWTHVVNTVVCTPDDGWRYHPKHVEQFSDKINCVT